MNLICLICTDDIKSDCSAPRCGHIFHSECLKHWLQLNKTCPQCRAKCSKVADVIKLYLNSEGELGAGYEEAGPAIDTECSPRKLRSRISEYEHNLSEKEADLAILREELYHCKDENESLRCSRTKFEKKYHEEHKIVSQLNRELKSVYSQFDKITDEHDQTAKRCHELENSAKVYKLIQSVIDNGKTDIEFLVASYGDGPIAVRSIAQSLFHLKKNYDELKELNQTIRNEKEKAIKEMREIEKKYSQKAQDIVKANSKILQYSTEYFNLKSKHLKLKQSIQCPEKATISSSPSQDCKSKAKRPKVFAEDNPDPLSNPFSEILNSNVVTLSISSPEKKSSQFNTIHKGALPINLRPSYKKFSLTKTTPFDNVTKRKLSQNKKASTLNPSIFCFEKTNY
ncbi:TRAF-interacting protein-like [Oopsacas minuta]|uniref:TRAF-interacting protein-like n=1 Tax=Oopsacas minuta TaxID=111878 RepID=A0AAV7JAP7_9METZ|nr:TRAF-interacting protein-like [Oopsacas minuta]